MDKEWTYWTYNRYWDESMMFAKSLVQMNVGNFKIVNILGFNSVRFDRFIPL